MVRPTSPLLTSQKIHRAALDLFDEQRGFSIPRLAKKLGVSPSSLYHHVKGGRTEIIKGIRSLISQDANSRGDFPPGEGTWQEQVRRWAVNYRDAMQRHPMAIPALVGEPVDDNATLNIYESLAQVLASAGFEGPALLGGLAMVDVLVLGAAIDAASPEPLWSASKSHHPALHTALSAQPGARRQDLAFELGLDAVITKLEAMLTATTGPVPGTPPAQSPTT